MAFNEFTDEVFYEDNFDDDFKEISYDASEIDDSDLIEVDKAIAFFAHHDKDTLFETPNFKGDFSHWIYSPDRQVADNRLNEVMSSLHGMKTYFHPYGNQDGAVAYRIRMLVGMKLEIHVFSISRHNALPQLYKLGYDGRYEKFF